MNESYEFGGFVLNPEERLLLRDGKPIPLTPKAFELLLVLVQHSGHLVENDKLLSAVWADVAVEEGNLAVLISHLRKALGDDRESHIFIETVPHHGYRFVAPVTQRIETPVIPSEPISQDQPLEPAEAVSGSRPGRVRQMWLRPGSSFALIVFVVCATALVWHVTGYRSTVAASVGPIHSLAILPFQEIGGGNGANYLGEGTADAIITRLSRFNTLIVRPTSAIERYQKSTLTPVQIGKQQSVDAVLEGLIQRQGDRVRLTVQLVRVRDSATLWANSFDEKYTNIFSLEDEISERVARSLQVHLSSAEVRRMSRQPTESPAAYDAYLKGRYFWNERTTNAVYRGLKYFRQAIQLDPHYADAYEGVADSYAILGLFASIPPNQAFPIARQAALKALSMDDSLADAHATLGLIDFYYNWDGAAAEDEFQRALTIDPHYAMGHSWSGLALVAMGHLQDAVTESQCAINDDPLSMSVNTNSGWTMFLAGHTDEALRILRKAIRFNPDFARAHFRLGIIYEAQGHFHQAIEQFKKAIQFSSNDNPYYEARLGVAYAEAGDTPEARQVLQVLRARARTEYIPAFTFFLIYAGLHDRQAACNWLQKALVDHSTGMPFLKEDPSLAGFRSDHRLVAVVQHLNFYSPG